MTPRKRVLAAFAGVMPGTLWLEKTLFTGPDKVRQLAKRILHQAAPGGRFIVGVSEDISDRGVDTLVPLACTVRNYGRIPIPTD